MQSTTAAHMFAQCSRACLRRGPVSTIRSAPAQLLATHAAPSLRTARGPSAQTSYPLNSGSGFLDVWPGHSVRRGFAHSAVRPKRSGGKKDVRSLKASPREDAEAADEDDSGGGGGGSGGGATHPQPDPADPFNFADVESRWQRSETHHDEKFKELRRALRGGILGDGEAGVVDVDAIGLTPVTVKGLEGDSSSSGSGGGGGGGSGKKGHANNHNSSSSSHGHGHKPAAAATAAVAPSTVPLSQLALVLPRAGGRIVELRMHNPASRKALMSAVQASPLFHGQQPQPDPDDELVLLVKVGGGGAEANAAGGGSVADAAAAAAAERARRVHDLANAWREQLRRATERRKKAHQAWKKDGTVRPDDLRRLDRDLLRGQEKRLARVDAVEKETLRQLEQTNRR